jgi:hypothetical protein
MPNLCVSGIDTGWSSAKDVVRVDQCWVQEPRKVLPVQFCALGLESSGERSVRIGHEIDNNPRVEDEAKKKYFVSVAGDSLVLGDVCRVFCCSTY